MTAFTSNPDAAPSQDVTESIESTVNLIEIIETVIASLQEDQSAMVNHSEQGHLWKFRYGTVEVFVQLTGTTDEDLFTVWSPIMQLPAKDEPGLMRKLLELNWLNTLESHFSFNGNQVVVSSRRTVAELSPSEVSRNITIVASIADEYDEPMQAQFG